MDTVGKNLVAIVAIAIFLVLGLFIGIRIGGFWGMGVCVTFAGAIGGIVNSIMNNSGFALPGPTTENNVTIYRTGYVGNILIGAVASFLSWGLYGPFASYLIIGSSSTADFSGVGLTLSAFAGAILVGISGSRWITKELDLDATKKGAALVLKKNNQPDAALRIMTESIESIIRSP